MTLPALSPYEPALQALLDPLGVVAPQALPLAEALGQIAAGQITPSAVPSHALARVDGWAAAALDLVGASVLSPLLLAQAPVWVEVGQELPLGCDCVLAPDLIARRGPMHLALAEALPGEGALRAGEWLAGNAALTLPGQKIGRADLLLAEAAGVAQLACHQPVVQLIDTSAVLGRSSHLVAAWLRQAGARVTLTCVTPAAGGRDVPGDFLPDLIVVIGGTGQGLQDQTAARLAQSAEVIAQGIGLTAAPTAILARRGACPVVALPGAPEAAMAGCLALLAPLMQRLTGRIAPPLLHLPLLRKISSQVGQAELVLLARQEQYWLPLAVGRATPEHFRRADGWLLVGSGDEGWPAGAEVAVQCLEGWG